MNEVAIIGMAGRFPGSRSVKELWNNLCAGKSGVVSLDDRQLAEQGIPTEITGNPNYVKAAAMIEDIDRFDADFFGYSPREAEITDPQHRLLLECAWEALESAGCVPERFEGEIGVFVGGSLSTYLLFNLFSSVGFSGPVDNIPMLIGNDKDYLATRLSYKLNLRGPSINIQTACSSSLVAVHQACQSLLNGECDAALAGGITIRVPHAVGYLYQEGGYLSPDGRCKAFAQEANGTIFGNGVGIVVLKRLADAVAAGDRIDAVIKGSAVNNDGATKVGFTAPSIEGQVRVISEAFAVAGVSPETISFVEAHGTGTPLGDPIEIAALSQVFQTATNRKQFCAIGSVKTNVGHLESAAGVTGLIKAVLALKHRQLPPSLNCETPSERINFPNTPFYVNTRLSEWQDGVPLRAAVSSFGIGGTNAHLVLEEFPESARKKTEKEAEKARLFILTAHSEEALSAQAANYRDWLCERSEHRPLFDDICYTLSQRRKHHPHRLAVVAENAGECAKKLESFLKGDPAPGVFAGKSAEKSATRLAFVFSGQGAQWAGMGRRLLKNEPVFRRMMDACEQEVQTVAGWSVIEELSAEQKDSNIDGDSIEITQVALFCLQVSLAAVWQSYGLQPSAVIGHSMGEIAAAFVAGALNLTDAVRVIATRSRLLQSVTQRGAMAAIELPVREIEQELVPFKDSLGIAACNSSFSTVVSGDAHALEEFLALLEKRAVGYRLLRTTGVAGHSPQVEPQRLQLVQALQDISPKTARLQMVSTNTGRFINEQKLDADYWGRNLREPVLFSEGIKELINTGHTVFLELGPHPVLAGAITEGLEEAGIDDCLVLHSLRREEEETAFLCVPAQLFVQGHPFKQEKIFPEGGSCIETPSFAWQRQRHWVERAPVEAHRLGNTAGSTNAGSARSRQTELHWIESSIKPRTFLAETLLNAEFQPWLADHVVSGEVIVPAALYLDWVCQAGAFLFPSAKFAVEGFTIQKPLIIPDEAEIRMQIALEQHPNKSISLQISSFDAQPGKTSRWTTHVRCELTNEAVAANDHRPFPEDAELQGLEKLENTRFYSELSQIELEYGPSYRVIETIRHDEQEAFARLQTPLSEREEKASARVGVFQLDGLLQTLLPLCSLSKPSENEHGQLVLPVSIKQMTVQPFPGQQLRAAARLRKKSESGVEADLALTDQKGQPVVNIDGLELRPLEAVSSLTKLKTRGKLLHKVIWQQHKNDGGIYPQTNISPGFWLILADKGGIGEELRAGLEAKGERCEMIGSQEALENAAAAPLSVRLRSILDQGDGDLRGVIHLWNLDQSEVIQESEAFPIERAQKLGGESVVDLLKTLSTVVRENSKQSPRVWLITSGAQLIEEARDHSIAVNQSLTWGIGRVAAYEFSELAPTVCDLSTRRSQTEIDNLFHEIWSGSKEREIALRGDAVYVRRLVRQSSSPVQNSRALKPSGLPAPFSSQLPSSRSLPDFGKPEPDFDSTGKFRPDASYLIAGGFGGLGLATAKTMAARGAKHILVIGRSQPDESVRREIEILRKEGIKVNAIVADVTDTGEMAALFAQIKRDFPPLKGIIQSVGVLSDSLIENLDPAQMQLVLAPKILGSWHLHCFSRDVDLDFFILYSSVASILGSPGQASHAAANAFLDAFAYYRKSLNLPALSINWGPWEAIGKAADDFVSQPLAARGLTSLPPGAALEILNELFTCDLTQVGVFDLDQRKWADYYPHLKIYDFFNNPETESLQKAAQPVRNIKQEIEAAPVNQRRSMMQNLIRAQAARILGLEPENLEPTIPLQNYGLDSLRALEFRNALEKLTEQKISAVICWKYPTIAQLSLFLGHLLTIEFDDDTDVSPEVFRKPPTHGSGATLVNLSEAETLSLLKQKLEALK